MENSFNSYLHVLNAGLRGILLLPNSTISNDSSCSADTLLRRTCHVSLVLIRVQSTTLLRSELRKQIQHNPGIFEHPDYQDYILTQMLRQKTNYGCIGH